MNSLQYAISRTILSSSYLMGKEVTNIENLRSGYGGGYEMISYVNGKFRKIDDINHIIWIANEDNEGRWKLQLPRLFMKYEYCDDILMIRRGEFLDKPFANGLIQMAMVNECVHLISPIYRHLSKHDLEDIRKKELSSLNSRFLCHSILMFKKSGMVNCRPYLNYSGNGTNPIHFSQNKNQVYLEIEPALIEQILKTVLNQPSS